MAAEGAEARPTGTVTFLFTDIESSTRLWEAHPRLMAGALARHDELLRRAVGEHGGVVFSTGGDGLAAVFPRAADAVVAAGTAQAAFASEPWPAPVSLRVRMAVHTGEAEERVGDYFGPAVNRAARIMTMAAGGDVLVSRATADVVDGRLPDGWWLEDQGEQQLRSLARPEQLFALVWPGGPPPRALARTPSRPGNLASARADLIGRDGDAAVVARLVETGKLVTLTGVGGVGKTALSLRVAHELAPTMDDGVWVCELAGVLKGDEVNNAVAEMLGLRPQSGLSQEEAVVRSLAAQRCLVVMDNCEHVLDDIAALVDAIVTRAEAVRILATSREPLGVPGERVVAVHPLGAEAAAQLFRERVAEHLGGFVDATTPADDALVSRLCEDLDGLPLAIELAAARARTMPLADLVTRLGERFHLLRGQRLAAERHQTLRATVGWSYELLTAEEKLLFDRLSVFAGGFTLPAAERVCSDAGFSDDGSPRGNDDVTAGALDAVGVDELVASLADRSMIVADPPGRYLLLETLRQFGEERLVDRDRFRRRHVAYFTRFSVEVHHGLQGPDEMLWWRRLQADWANVRAAFAWAVAAGHVDAAATIAVHLVWAATFHETGEPLLWVDEVAAMPGVEEHPLWPSVLGCRAWAAWDRGELDAAADLGRLALAAEQPGQHNLDYFAEIALLSAAFFSGDTSGARRHLDQALSRASLDGKVAVQAMWDVSHVILDIGEGNSGGGLVSARRARRLAEQSGNPSALAWALSFEATTLANLGDPSAPDVGRQAFDLATETEAVLAIQQSRRTLAALLLASGRRAEAAQLLLAALRAARRKTSAGMWVQQGLIYACDALVAPPSTETAAVIYGAARRSSAAGAGSAVVRLGRIRDDLVVRLSADRLEALAAEGEILPIDRVIKLTEQALASLVS